MNNQKTITPYIINCFYNWAMDNKKIPLLVIKKSEDNIMPSFLREQESITLHFYPHSIRNLIFSKDFLFFTTFFDTEPFHLTIPYVNIVKIFCKDDNYGINFEPHKIETSYNEKHIDNILYVNFSHK